VKGRGGWVKGWKRYGPRGKRRPLDEGLADADDVAAFLAAHARALAPLIARFPGEAQLKRLAVGYRELLAGGAHARWIALVRELGRPSPST
jgi:hypothetical protein